MDRHTALRQRQRDSPRADPQLERRSTPGELGEKGDGGLDHRRVEHVAARRVVPSCDLLAEVVLGHASNLAGAVQYGPRMADTPVEIVPANKASWEDLQAVFGTRGDPSHCQCQRYKMQPKESWASVGREELGFRLRTQTDCGHPDSGTTSGLVAYLDGEPVGWCAVEPRTAYPRLLLKTRVPWDGRDEDKADDSVWAVTCFVTRAGFRRRGDQPCARTRRGRLRARAAAPAPSRATRCSTSLHRDGSCTSSTSAAAACSSTRASPRSAGPTVRRVVMRIDF